MTAAQFQDEQERADVDEILTEVDAVHPARAAYRQGAGTLQISQLMQRTDLRKRLEAAYRAALERYLKGLPFHN